MGLDKEDLQEIIADFIVEAGESLDQLDQDLVALEKNVSDVGLMNRIFRNLHTIKGSANFLNAEPLFAEMARVAHAAEDLMGLLREGKLALENQMMDVVLEAVDVIKKLLGQAQSGEKEVGDFSPLCAKLRSFSGKTSASVASVPASAQKKEAKAQISSPEKPDWRPPVEAPTHASPLKNEGEKEKLASREASPLGEEKVPSEKINRMEMDEEDLQEIIQDFLAESKESIEQLDQNLVHLEDKKEDRSLLDAIFRTLHTIKGTANFLNAKPDFRKMGQIAHAAEDLIGALREGQISLTPAMMDLILFAVDSIKTLIQCIEKGKQSTTEPTELIQQLRNFLGLTGNAKKNIAAPPKMPLAAHPVKETIPEKFVPAGKSSLSEEDKQELIQDFLAESKELVEKMDQDLIQLEKTPENRKLLEQVFRHMHTLKGTTSFLGFQEISRLAHATEDVMKETSTGSLVLSAPVMDVVLESVDVLKNFFRRLEKGEKEEGDHRSLIERLHGVSGREERYPKAAPPILESPVEAPNGESGALSRVLKSKRQSASQEQTIRVETARLDKLMNLVGELVLGRNRLMQVLRNLMDKNGDERSCQELVGAVDFIDFVTSDLQMAVLKTRMQPISKIFNRFTRTVRDLARELGKDVRLVIKGAETELDKSVIDELGDPLIHLLRNSVDHGIELPKERLARGKSQTGTIVLSAFYEGNHILIDLRDDGKGIDTEAIKKKAIEKGMVSAHEVERLHPKEVMEFIFRPGFSTASVVTSVSGRGVGMDVVKTNIEKLNGMVEINSVLGEGTVITIRLPLTLAIVQALQVAVENEIFSIPLTSVIETIRINHHQILTVSGREVIRFRDTIIPLIRLDTLFEFTGNHKSKPEKIYIVVTAIADKKIGLVVEKIVGQEEVVVKSLGKLLENTPGISGACIGGDGKVTLILDIAGIFRLLPHNIGAMVGPKQTGKWSSSQKRTKTWSILIVEDSRSERKRTRLTLESKGYKVVEASEGREALSKLMDYQIDLVITDIEMPELDGYELTSKIREHKKFRTIPVIAISSHKEMIDRIKGMECGINTYLPKPFDEQELFNSIKNLLP